MKKYVFILFFLMTILLIMNSCLPVFNLDLDFDLLSPRVNYIIIYPEVVYYLAGHTFQFNEYMSITKDPDTSFHWNVLGESAGTHIDSNGFLTIGENETAETLIITATSVFNPQVVGYAYLYYDKNNTVDIPDFNSYEYEIKMSYSGSYLRGDIYYHAGNNQRPPMEPIVNISLKGHDIDLNTNIYWADYLSCYIFFTREFPINSHGETITIQLITTSGNSEVEIRIPDTAKFINFPENKIFYKENDIIIEWDCSYDSDYYNLSFTTRQFYWGPNITVDYLFLNLNLAGNIRSFTIPANTLRYSPQFGFMRGSTLEIQNVVYKTDGVNIFWITGSDIIRG